MSWDNISDLYHKYFQTVAAKQSKVDFDEMLVGLESMRSVSIIWHDGKTLPAATTVTRSIIDTQQGKFAPNLSMILQTYHEEPPMTSKRTREKYNDVQKYWAEAFGRGTPLWKAMRIKDESAFLKAIEAYFVLGIMTGCIKRPV